MNNSNSKISFIEKIFGDYTVDGNFNLSIKCPNCASENTKKRKLSIKLENDKFHCWVCDFRGKSLLPLLKKYSTKENINEYINKFYKKSFFKKSQETKDNFKEQLVLPPGFTLLAEYKRNNNTQFGIYAEKAFEYIKSRNLYTIEDFWRFKFGITGYKKYINRIIFPSFDSNGILNYYVCRTWNINENLKYLNSAIKKQEIIFNEIDINWKIPLTIVEGPFDTTKCSRNTTCLLGNTLSTDSLLFEKIILNDTPIILMLDNDMHEKSCEIAKLLLNYGIKISIIFLKNKKDPCEHTRDEISDLILENQNWNFNKIDILRKKIANI